MKSFNLFLENNWISADATPTQYGANLHHTHLLSTLEVITLGLVLVLIVFCVTTIITIYALILWSIPYPLYYKKVTTSIQTLTYSVLEHLSALRSHTKLYIKLTYWQTRSHIKFFVKWAKTPLPVIMFPFFILLNFILFLVYLPLLYLCIIYWLFMLFGYTTCVSVAELKPYQDFEHPNTMYTTYTHYLKAQTFYKAYLVSFSIVYRVAKFLLSEGEISGRYNMGNVLSFIGLFCRAIFWLIIRLVTSLPRAVLVDSYWCSRFFIVYNGLFMDTVLTGGKTTYAEFFVAITSRFNTSVIHHLNDTLVPIMYKRIFKTSSSNYNFNPNFSERVTKL